MKKKTLIVTVVLTLLTYAVGIITGYVDFITCSEDHSIPWPWEEYEPCDQCKCWYHEECIDLREDDS